MRHNIPQNTTFQKRLLFFFSEVLVCILKCVFRKMSLCCFLSPLCEMLCLLKCCYVFLRLSRVEAQTMYRCTDCKARWGNAILILGYMNNIDWIWIRCFVRYVLFFKKCCVLQNDVSFWPSGTPHMWDSITFLLAIVLLDSREIITWTWPQFRWEDVYPSHCTAVLFLVLGSPCLK